MKADMKLAHSRPTTHGERIAALEQARTTDSDRLVKIESTLDEIRILLIRGRTLTWLATKVFAGVGGVAAVGASIVLITRFITGR